MRMRIKIKKSGAKWVGEYNLPTGAHMTVSGGQGFELFCLLLMIQWKRDAEAMRRQGWRIKY